MSQTTHTNSTGTGTSTRGSSNGKGSSFARLSRGGGTSRYIRFHLPGDNTAAHTDRSTSGQLTSRTCYSARSLTADAEASLPDITQTPRAASAVPNRLKVISQVQSTPRSARTPRVGLRVARAQSAPVRPSPDLEPVARPAARPSSLAEMWKYERIEAWIKDTNAAMTQGKSNTGLPCIAE